ncbi:MAG: GNAT family N-acetyltransferase [Sandaracinaceae bacterium]
MTPHTCELVVRPLSPEDVGLPTPGLRTTATRTVDSRDHYALAVGLRQDGETRGIALARWLRDPEDPTAAWAQIGVASSAQGRGLGMLLFRSLGHVASLRGVERLLIEVRPGDVSLRTFLAHRGVLMAVRGRRLVGRWATADLARVRPSCSWGELAERLQD